jgi:hypothetical protein
MAPSDILKCSGPSFPVGFSTSKTCRLMVSLIVFPLAASRHMLVLDAVGAQKTLKLHTLCAFSNASSSQAFPQREHSGPNWHASAAA